MTDNPSHHKIPRLVPGILFALAALWLYWPVLRPGALLFGNDTIFHDYIMLFYGWSALKHGSLSLWLPHLYCGIPFIGSFAFCPWYPPALAFLVVPFPLAFNLQYILHSFLAGAFTYRLLRAMNLDRISSVFGGLAFQLCGHFATLAYPGHLQKVQAIVWIPLALSFVHKGLFSGKRRHFLYAGAALAMPLLSSHPQIYYYGVCAILLYALWRLGDRRRVPVCDPPQTLLSRLSLALIFSLALSAIQIIPGYETARHSVRAGGLPFEQSVKSSYPPSELLELILPRYKGDSVRGGFGDYYGSWGERLVSDYPGMAVQLLALLALFLSPRKEKLFLNILFLLAAVIACGAYSPIYHVLWRWVPGMRHFRSPATVMFLMSLPLCILASFGLEVFLKIPIEDSGSKKVMKLRRAVPFLALLFGLTCILAHFYVLRAGNRHQEFAGTGSEAELFYRRAWLLAVSLRRSAFFAALVCGALGLLDLVRRRVHLTLLPAAAVWIPPALLLVFHFMDAGMNDRVFIQPEPAAQYHEYLFHSWPAPDMRVRARPVHLLEVGNEYSNRHILSSVGSPSGYHPIELRSYMDAWQAAGPGSLKAARLTATRYFTMSGRRRTDPGCTQISASRVTGRRLYQWDEEMPHAWIPSEIRSFRNQEEVLEAIKAEDFNPREVSLLESENNASWKRSLPEQAFRLSIEEYSDNRIILNATLPEESWIVMADAWMPGWRAHLENGTPLLLSRANGAFRAVKAPAGDSVIRLEYRPASLIHGSLISIFGLLVWVGLCVVDKKTGVKRT